MDNRLKAKLVAAAGAGGLAVAMIIADYHEGGRIRTTYLDPVGIPTACRGVTGADVILGKTYTDAECEAMEAFHFAIAQAAARRALIHFDDYNQWRQGALIDFAYNVGGAALMSSTMARKFNAGDEQGGCAELARWVKGRVRGVLVTLRGLVNRRADQFDLCLKWSGGDRKYQAARY